ncbi:helix-turn-helix domain-containing protein [Synechococcus sp. PCC 7336]|uniref:helix-turn-helix domain-containing protein n=1 Tax=Synechococcus sp. PCC 7336 TaxID=195250 RepID=UPI000345D628|nr:helix-turn-helix transcriptional regulator [Synechococcus sp. PCC 7336]
MTGIQELHQKWSVDSDYQAEYDKLNEEFEIAKALIQARVSADLTQAEVARRMQTTQSVIARLEGGKGNPSISLGQIPRRLRRFTGAKVRSEGKIP